MRRWRWGAGIALCVILWSVLWLSRSHEAQARVQSAPALSPAYHQLQIREHTPTARAAPSDVRGAELVIALALLQAAWAFALVLELRARHRSERSIRETQAQLSLAAVATNLGLWRWDAKTEELWATDNFRNILGLPPRVPVLLSAIRARVHPADLTSFDSLFASTYGSFDCEFRVQTPSGEMRWVSSHMHATRDSYDRVINTIGVIQDITEPKHSEVELRQQRMQLTHLTRLAILGQFSGALAHEITQPLTSILSNAQAAQRVLSTKKSDLQEVREILGDIVNDDLRAGEVIQRLKELLKRGEAHMLSLDVPQLISEVLSVARGELTGRHIEVQLRVDAGLPVVQGDRVQIKQILLNLLLNASDAMASNRTQDRTIEICASRADEDVRISVSDQGTGIAPEQLDSIFDAFYTTKSGGLGLGLAICRSIVTAHGGRLWATNNVGRGATLHFTLREHSALPIDFGSVNELVTMR